MTGRAIGGHHSARMGNDEWLTPPEILNALGPFDLDPCSPIERPWPTAARHFTALDRGLSREWFGSVWCNPPYGREAGKWLARCAEHGDAVALVFARTETRDWAEHVWGKATAVLFLFGRLHFHYVDGTRAKANSGAPSALIAYGHDAARRLANCGLHGKLIGLQGGTDNA